MEGRCPGCLKLAGRIVRQFVARRFLGVMLRSIRQPKTGDNNSNTANLLSVRRWLFGLQSGESGISTSN